MATTTEAWRADRAWSVERASSLLGARFPDLAGRPVEPLGEGWDNAAYLVDDAWVFRFVRRDVAVPGMRHEIALLPALAPMLPVDVPVPARVADDDGAPPWPFAGYRLLEAAGDACGAPVEVRAGLAEPLGRLLRTLHAVDLADRGGLAGVIDWGDVHLGDPALDLSVAWSLLPRRSHAAFLDTYGPVDDETWRRARFRALHYGLILSEYGEAVGDARIAAAGALALQSAGEATVDVMGISPG